MLGFSSFSTTYWFDEMALSSFFSGASWTVYNLSVEVNSGVVFLLRYSSSFDSWFGYKICDFEFSLLEDFGICDLVTDP